VNILGKGFRCLEFFKHTVTVGLKFVKPLRGRGMKPWHFSGLNYAGCLASVSTQVILTGRGK
jgi:hypothetical protein